MASRMPNFMVILWVFEFLLIDYVRHFDSNGLHLLDLSREQKIENKFLRKRCNKNNKE